MHLSILCFGTIARTRQCRIAIPIGHVNELTVYECSLAVDLTCVVDRSRDFQPHFNVACTTMKALNYDTYELTYSNKIAYLDRATTTITTKDTPDRHPSIRPGTH